MVDTLNSGELWRIAILDDSIQFGKTHYDILVNGEWFQSNFKRNFDQSGKCVELETLVNFLTSLSAETGFIFTRKQ